MFTDCGKIVGGDWDLSNSKFKFNTIYKADNSSETIYQSLKMRFHERKDWTETPLVKGWLKLIREGKRAGHGCTTEDLVFQRFEKLDLLYHEIKTYGYKSKLDIINSSYRDPAKVVPSRNPELFWYQYDEVVVNVGRGGEFLFVGGHHRLSMALIAGIDSIPVRLFVRHNLWQEYRDQLYLGKVTLDNAEIHPDLVDVI